MRVVAATNQIATGTATKTLVQIAAATGRTVRPTQIEITLDGTSPTADPIEFQLLRQTTAGTSTSLTLRHMNGLQSETIDSTAGENFTVEPTAGDILRRWFLHPQGGALIYTVPEPNEWTTGAAGRLGIRAITPGATVNALINIEFEE